MNNEYKIVNINAVSSLSQAKDDKASLPYQRQKCEAAARDNGWQIVDTIEIPGHSRDYLTFEEMRNDALKKGIDGFARIEDHWKNDEIDGFIIYKGNRIARSQALHAYFVEKSIQSGKWIYVIGWGMVNDQTLRAFISIDGYHASKELDDIVEKRRFGIANRAKKGLPVASRDIISHNVLRDGKGKAIKRVLNPEIQILTLHLGQLLLEGIAYDRLETVLYERHGYTDSDGKPYYAGYWYKRIMNPVFWGHTAQHHNNTDSKNGFRNLMYFFDPDNYDLPDGVIFHLNTHEAVWQGDFGDDIKQEILRRSQIVKGNSSPKNTHRFSGLCLCGECFTFMKYHNNGNYRGIKHTDDSKTNKRCSNRKLINEKKLIVFMNSLLEQYIELQDFVDFTENNDQNISKDLIAKSYLDRRKDLYKQKDNLVQELTETKEGNTESVKEILRQKMYDVIAQIDILSSAIESFANEEASKDSLLLEPEKDLKQYKEAALEHFWNQESRYINQMLHRLLGNKRIVILDGEIVAIAHSIKKQRNHK